MNPGIVLAGAARNALPIAPAHVGSPSAGGVVRTSKPAAARSASATRSAAGAAGKAAGGAPSAAQRQADVLAGLLATFVKAMGPKGIGTAAAGSPKPQASASPSAGASGGATAFLRDPRLSVEEKLARLMVLLSDKYEKQLDEKLRQYGDLEGGKRPSNASSAKSAASGTGGSGSPLSSLGDGLKGLFTKAGLGTSLVTGTFLPQLATQVAAPVLAGAATALGMPALAPLILKAGPLLGSVASGALSALTSGAGKATGSATGASSSSSSSASPSSADGAEAPSEKQLMTEIQILQEKQKEMFALVSNILRSMHDTKMSVIGNIR